MQIVLLGAPGCGKGTQAKLMSDRYSIPVFSVGKILRSLIKDTQNPLSKVVNDVIKNGYLVNDELSTSLVVDSITSKNTWDNFIIDGFPRTVHQGFLFEKHLLSINLAYKNLIILDIEIDLETVILRTSQRFMCKKCEAIYNYAVSSTKVKGICDICHSTELFRRSDDDPEIVRNRISVYNKSTYPVIERYKKYQNFRSIPGIGEIDEVFGRIVNVLEEIKAGG